MYKRHFPHSSSFVQAESAVKGLTGLFIMVTNMKNSPLKFGDYANLKQDENINGYILNQL